MAPGLRLTVLVDNNTLTDRYFAGEPGLSFFLETAGKKILFDCGYSDLFLANAARMGVDLRDLDSVILSHGHLDHTWGLVPLIRFLTEAVIERTPHTIPRLIAHPRCLLPKKTHSLQNIGSLIDETEAHRQFRVLLTQEPAWITDDLVFLGEIPRIFPFEETDPGKRRILLTGVREEPDLLLDDSALAYRSRDGLVIITGCSHAGICNITDYAREISGERKVIDIIGGLHLLAPPVSRLEKTGEYFRQLGVSALHACHCTSLRSRIALAAYAPMEEVGVGLTLVWE